ncbi:hypothetical protein I551_8971 [Mycobacterium ulcerans str. Harvey]|uniref:Uncharacterized protein n=1 Tax=Mycobacterium ulcerans str. Harvey TaxID=1299332 RepID=A0ABN0R9A9_MYCUL|nr:hypothetical protein I551_8971 [Mycobacterium ulcerans str. Harvey]
MPGRRLAADLLRIVSTWQLMRIRAQTVSSAETDVNNTRMIRAARTCRVRAHRRP